MTIPALGLPGLRPSRCGGWTSTVAMPLPAAPGMPVMLLPAASDVEGAATCSTPRRAPISDPAASTSSSTSISCTTHQQAGTTRAGCARWRPPRNTIDASGQRGERLFNPAPTGTTGSRATVTAVNEVGGITRRRLRSCWWQSSGSCWRPKAGCTVRARRPLASGPWTGRGPPAARSAASVSTTVSGTMPPPQLVRSGPRPG